MKKYKTIFITGLLLLPSLAWAQLTQTGRLIDRVGEIADVLIAVLVALALLAFFWGLVKFIFSAGDENAVDAGKRIMIWGLIALFVMVSIWGLINFIQSELRLDTSPPPPVRLPTGVST